MYTQGRDPLPLESGCRAIVIDRLRLYSRLQARRGERYPSPVSVVANRRAKGGARRGGVGLGDCGVAETQDPRGPEGELVVDGATRCVALVRQPDTLERDSAFTLGVVPLN